MVKAILQAIPSYLFSVFRLPDTLLKKMDSIIARFWWAGDARRRTIHWCSIDKLSTSKGDGGLGFRSFREFNLAFLAKLAWKIIKMPNALWVRVLKALYFPSDDFVTVKQKRCSSWIWSSILQGRDTLVKGIRKNIGNGNTTWLDEAWFPGSCDFRCYPNPSLNCRVSDCMVQGRQCWDVEKLRAIFPEDMVREIRKIPIGPPHLEDKWLWHGDKKGKFSVKGCYWLMKNGNTQPREARGQYGTADWKWLWQLKIPSKVKLFLWRGCCNILPTRMNLYRRSCCDSSRCLGCNEQDESTEHMLLSCRKIGEFWREAAPFAREVEEGESFMQWLMRSKDNLQPPHVIKLICCCWFIWKQRNDLVFRNNQLDRNSMIRRMESEVALWNSVVISAATINPDSGTINNPSVPLPTNVSWTIQCDGSFQEGIQKAGVGIILFDSEGHAIDGRAGSFFCRTPSVAEAVAVSIAVQMANETGRQVQILSDCLEVVNALKAPADEWPWEIGAIIADIMTVLQGNNNISVNHCRRSGLRAAHNTANQARLGFLLPNWVANL
ncbi:Putative ribonuclease H protein At1g65750 [Linum perenne]